MSLNALILLFILPQLFTRSATAVAASCPSTSNDENTTVIGDPEPSLTCRNVTCKRGEVCQLQQVQCIRAPCPPIPTCTPIKNTTCPPNERYLECGSCEGSCKTGPPQICTKICRIGCSCVYADGNVRDDSGKCVSIAQCPGVLTCQTVKCSAGYICQMVDSDCASLNATQPCWPKPRCVPDPALSSTPATFTKPSVLA